MKAEIPELARKFSEEWYNAGERELSAMVDMVPMNASGESQKAVFLASHVYRSYPEMLTAAKKAMHIATTLCSPMLGTIVKEVPHFAARPAYLMEESIIGVTVWVNAYVVLEGGEAAYDSVLAEARAEADAWEKAAKGDYGPVEAIQFRERNKGRMPSYRTASLELSEGDKNILHLLQRD